MRKPFALIVAAALAAVLTTIGFAPAATAQDTVFGTITADPEAVPAAGEYTLTATGADFIPDTQVLLVKCISPADTLVFGESSLEAITEAALAMDPLSDCDLASAVPVEVDSAGAWTQTFSAEVGDNFFLSAGALDGSQAGAVWIPIVGEAALADTGVETGVLAVVGAALLGAGAMLAREARRH